ncbi:putative Na+-dependent transporter [Algoriphagus sp. 4150]|uniref:bile acid:sodium symporter n=1 Tax=Algoriphagus sp. 4150 TaxID=2817756 RepID=UPI00285B4538|nr:bile acid:sodium symporter [Algoriphagus sp. 4150]MDR7130816.1 putative Na+-dependent transporter [Algoriphagus sp. 4150]
MKSKIELQSGRPYYSTILWHKKSLIHGTVFSKVLFPVGYPIGIILLPLMLFHAFQLFVASIMASNFAKRENQPAQS